MEVIVYIFLLSNAKSIFSTDGKRVDMLYFFISYTTGLCRACILICSLS